MCKYLQASVPTLNGSLDWIIIDPSLLCSDVISTTKLYIMVYTVAFHPILGPLWGKREGWPPLEGRSKLSTWFLSLEAFRNDDVSRSSSDLGSAIPSKSRIFCRLNVFNKRSRTCCNMSSNFTLKIFIFYYQCPISWWVIYLSAKTLLFPY